MTGVEFLEDRLPSLLEDDSGHYRRLFDEAKEIEQTRLKEAAIGFYLYMSGAVRHASHDKCYEIWLERQNNTQNEASS